MYGAAGTLAPGPAGTGPKGAIAVPALLAVLGACALLSLAADPLTPAAETPAPISRVASTHRLVALTLRAPGTLPWLRIAHVLHDQGAQATVFLTTAQLKGAPAGVRALLAAGSMEAGLAGPLPNGRLELQAERAERLLGDRPALYQPASRAAARAQAASAYRAGLLTVLWSRSVSGAAAGPEGLSSVQPGEIVRLDLDAGEQGVRELSQALARLRGDGLAVTSAGGLIEDASAHLRYCLAGSGAPSPALRPTSIEAAYPGAPLAPRALWRLGAPGRAAVRRLYGVRPSVRLAGRAVGGLLPGELHSAVRELAARMYIAPVDATLRHEDGAVLPDRVGRRVEEAATYAAVRDAERGAEVAPVVRSVAARWRTEDITSLTQVLGSYRTWIDGSSGRYLNVAKGAAHINNRLVLPGETFSTLGAIGDPTKQRGWHPAPVIVWGSYQQGVGGGLCQVSSTLYNAVARAGLRIVERHHHAKAVHYVPRGKDATIAWPSLDFRFANDGPRPVLIKAYVRGGALWTTVLGSTGT